LDSTPQYTNLQKKKLFDKYTDKRTKDTRTDGWTDEQLRRVDYRTNSTAILMARKLVRCVEVYKRKAFPSNNIKIMGTRKNLCLRELHLEMCCLVGRLGTALRSGILLQLVSAWQAAVYSCLRILPLDFSWIPSKLFPIVATVSSRLKD
jgi:hypothetical protein